MNRAINIFTFLVLGVFCFMVYVLVYDLSLSNLSLKGLVYQREIFTSLALVVLLLGLVRIQRRWQGMRDMKRYTNFVYVVPVSKSQRQQGIIITLLEVMFFTSVILFCQLFMDLNPEYVLPMLGVLSLLVLESLVFIYRLQRGGDSFRVGLNNDLIAYFDREMHLFYYTGLMRVELNQTDLINFGYRDGLNITLATTAIPVADRKAFRDALITILESKNVYIDDSLRNWE